MGFNPLNYRDMTPFKISVTINTNHAQLLAVRVRPCSDHHVLSAVNARLIEYA